MVPPVKVQLTYEERRALEALALRNFRRPSEELRRLLQDELRRGPLDAPDPPTKNEGYANVSEAAGAPFGIQS